MPHVAHTLSGDDARTVLLALMRECPAVQHCRVTAERQTFTINDGRITGLDLFSVVTVVHGDHTITHAQIMDGLGATMAPAFHTYVMATGLPVMVPKAVTVAFWRTISVTPLDRCAEGVRFKVDMRLAAVPTLSADVRVHSDILPSQSSLMASASRFKLIAPCPMTVS